MIRISESVSAARKAMVFSSELQVEGTVTFQVLATIRLASSSGIESTLTISMNQRAMHGYTIQRSLSVKLHHYSDVHMHITSKPRRRKHYQYESMRQREEFILWRFGRPTIYKYGCQRNPDVSQIPPSQFKMQFKPSLLVFFFSSSLRWPKA
jgi:hypothetical protein